MHNKDKPITTVRVFDQDNSEWVTLDFHMTHEEAIGIYDPFQWSRGEWTKAEVIKYMLDY